MGEVTWVRPWAWGLVVSWGGGGGGVCPSEHLMSPPLLPEDKPHEVGCGLCPLSFPVSLLQGLSKVCGSRNPRKLCPGSHCSL